MRLSIKFNQQMQVGHKFCGHHLILEKVYRVSLEHCQTPHPWLHIMYIADANPHMNQYTQTATVVVHLSDIKDVRFSNDKLEY